jgi:hypothetical protein
MREAVKLYARSGVEDGSEGGNGRETVKSPNCHIVGPRIK